MMFLLRTAFWIGVVLALLPTFAPKPSAPSATGFNATEAVTAASATFGDMIQFCNRQPDACAAGAQFAAAFGQRAQAGAKMLYDMVGERLAMETTDSVGQPAGVQSRPSQNTLTAADIALSWRGPRHKGAI
jgi:Family of unknown function (DUF5330)